MFFQDVTWSRTGSKISIFRQVPTGDWNFFFSRHMQKCGCQNVLRKFFLCSEEQIDANYGRQYFSEQRERGVGSNCNFFH